MRRISTAAALLLVLGACGCSGPDQHASDDGRELDQSTKPVSGCGGESMLGASRGIPTIKADDATRICDVMTASLASPPPVGILRDMFRATALMKAAGLPEEPKEQAYQIMNVVEARGQTDPAMIHGTIDVLTKIAQGTNGHVSPRDMNIALRQSGSTAKTASDRFLITMASMIWEEKKARGE